MKTSLTTALIISCALATILADDIKTTTGQEYKNATISRAEPDGIVLIIGGKVRTISSDERGPLVKLDVPCDAGAAACGAVAYFTSAGGLSSFQPGNSISFVGTVEGVRGWTLILKDCYLP